MSVDRVHQDSELPLDACPSCDSTALELVFDFDRFNILCRECGRCWHVEFGRAARVDPVACMGCPHRDECLARFGEELT